MCILGFRAIAVEGLRSAVLGRYVEVWCSVLQRHHLDSICSVGFSHMRTLKP